MLNNQFFECGDGDAAAAEDDEALGVHGVEFAREVEAALTDDAGQGFHGDVDGFCARGS